MEIKVLFIISKDISPKYDLVKIGKYTIEPVPTNSSDLAASRIRYLLKFEDDDLKTRSNPEKEAALFLSFLALLLGCRLEIDSTMMNNVKTDILDSIRGDSYPELRAKIEELPPDFENKIFEIMRLEEEIAKQFLRACEVFRTAINLIGVNNTLSYFLLSISIECLSNKISDKSGICEKFVDFILTYLPDKSDFETSNEWVTILKEIYYNHRSGFTHGGRSLPDAVSLADRLNKKYIINTINGKEVRTPGLKWFSNIVQQSLLGFLSQVESKDEMIDHFKGRSLKSGVVHLKVKKNIEKGEVVTTDNVKID